MASRGLELSDDLKKRIVALHNNGKGYRKISRILKLSCSTVAKIIQRFKKTGSTQNRPRAGRPRKLSECAERHIQILSKKNRRRSAVDINAEIGEIVDQPVSSQTVRRTLHRIGLRGCRPRKKPLLKTAHKRARYQFAASMSTKSMSFWKNVLWSDETKINLFGSDGVSHVWRQPGEAYNDVCTMPTVKHGGGNVMVWGCMSAFGVGELHFIEGTMNSTMYCEILEQKMIPSLQKLSRRAVFQHDNDPKHTSRMTTAFLKRLRVQVMEWPSMSPDLNPIEHLWRILKLKVEKHNVSNIHQLRDIVLKEWKKIPVETCEALVNSMPRRIKAVLQNLGGHTKY